MPYIPGQKAKAFFTQTKQIQPDNTAANKMGTYGAVAQGQTKAIGDEVQNVVKKSQDVNKVDTSFNTDNFTQKAAQPFKMEVPNLASGLKFSGVGAAPLSTDVELSAAKTALNADEAQLKDIQKTQTELDQGINKYGEQRMDELNKQSEQFQKNVGDLNMGQVGAESEVEQNANDFLKLLAERDPSNIGILKNLYGNYDSTKYGALDSNVLQGIINENRGEAENILNLRTQAEGAVDPAMKLYQNELDSLKNRTTEDYKKYGETTKALMDKYRSDASGFADKVATRKQTVEALEKKKADEVQAEKQRLQAEIDKANMDAADKARLKAEAEEAAKKGRAEYDQWIKDNRVRIGTGGGKDLYEGTVGTIGDLANGKIDRNNIEKLTGVTTAKNIHKGFKNVFKKKKL